MPYREKISWLSLLSMLAVFVPYFTWMKLYPPTENLPNFSQLALYAAVCCIWVSLLGIGHLVLRNSTPDEAKLPLDERDRAIQSRGVSMAYGVLMAGMIVVGCIMPFTDSGWTIVNTAIFMIVLAEVVRDATVVINYQRQTA